MIIYIYALVDPDNGIVRYIGATVDPTTRSRQHFSVPDFSQKSKWIYDLSQENKIPRYVILEKTNEKNARSREQHWIDSYDSIYLFNKADSTYYYDGNDKESKQIIEHEECDAFDLPDSLYFNKNISKVDILAKKILDLLEDKEITQYIKSNDFLNYLTNGSNSLSEKQIINSIKELVCGENFLAKEVYSEYQNSIPF